jgi:hypothetical protein
LVLSYTLLVLFKLIAASPVSENQNISKMHILASSTLNEWDDINKYSLINTFTNDNNTTWCEGVKGNGISEFIIMVFEDLIQTERSVSTIEIYYDIDTIRIKNGFTKSTATYYDNNRVKELTVTIHNHEMKKYSESFRVNLSDNSLDFQDIVIPEKYRKGINKIRLQIDSVFKGNNYDDTCISKIEFLHNNSKLRLTENALLQLHDYSLLKSEKLEDKFRKTSEQRCGNFGLYTKLIGNRDITEKRKDIENGLLVIDGKYFYVNDLIYTRYDIKAKYTKQGYKYRYRYKFENDRLHILNNGKWELMKFNIHYWSSIYDPSKDYDADYFYVNPALEINYDFIKGSYVNSSCDTKCEDDCIRKKLGPLYDQLIPVP